MKKTIILLGVTIFVSVAAFFVACNSVAKNDVSSNDNSQVITSTKKGFKVEFKSEPATIQAGASTALILVVKNEQGAIVKDLQIVHEKLMHLLIVSNDLAEFYHIHPEVRSDGSFKVEHIFPNGGNYRLYADITPKDSAQVVEQIDVKVAGTERPKAALVADTKFEKTVDGLRVVMTPNVEIQAGKELELNFKAFDAASGKPADDLQILAYNHKVRRRS